MSAPVIGITTWRRTLPTYLGAETELDTLGAEYADAVRAAGGIPILLPALALHEIESVLDSVDGVLLSGGQDLGLEPASDFQRDASEFGILAAAQTRSIPVFGICRGLQAINVFQGGSLIDDLAATTAHPSLAPDADQAASRHAISSSAKWIEDALPAGGIVNSIHHQAVDQLGGGLAAVAWAEDGTIEAIEGTEPGWFLRGVQWHPEKLPGLAGREHSTRILADFIAESSKSVPART